MSRLILFYQSKVALAIIGAVLCGGGAAWVAAVPFTGTPNRTASTQPQSYAGIAAIGTGTATPAARTPGKSPTATPTPTPTAGNGQPNPLRGVVANVDTSTNSFTVRVFGGATKSVIVTSQTTFQGVASSLSGLSPGWTVQVRGVYRADGALVASDVNSDN